MKKAIIIAVSLFVVVAAGLLYFFFYAKNLRDQIVIPYITHQKPKIDPHVPSSVPIADKLDEVSFDGLFNISANASGVTYEDGLGEFMGYDPKTTTVKIRLKPNKKWHSSWNVTMLKDKVTITDKAAMEFTAKDLRFTLDRIKSLGSISPDYILVSQAVPDFNFAGPDENGEITFQFLSDREWGESDIKEILSFKIIPEDSQMDAPVYNNGTGPYMYAGENEKDNRIFFWKSPAGVATLNRVILKPFIDNSTYTTELKNKNINTLLSTPFGAISPIIGDSTKYFYKSSIATTFFAIVYNVNRLNLDQRKALRSLIDNKKVLDRFFRIGTEQQRHIANYEGNGDNYAEYLNNSVFPTTSVYVGEQLVTPLTDRGTADLSVLPDTVRIKTCLNYDFKEELADLTEILNDPSLFGGKIKVSAVQNDEIRKGDYDAVLVAFSGYRSNFMFDLYNVFLREPDFETYKINLLTNVNDKGANVISDEAFASDKNFAGIDLGKDYPEKEDFKQLLNHTFKFMSTRELSDKQIYARLVDETEQRLALGSWLISLPSLAYFSAQFDKQSIDLYGTASQLSTIEKWKQSARSGKLGFSK
jgi:hypothetical protein